MKNSKFMAPLIGVLSLPTFAEKPLEEVVVSASRTETEARAVAVAVTVLDRSDIDKMGMLSMLELLRTQVGVAVSNNGGPGKDSSIRIRGEEGYRTLFLIDGIELTDPTGTQLSTRVEHLGVGQEIQRVEILRGPQGFSYGADAGGVVNIYTRSAERTEGALQVEDGVDNTQSYQAYLATKHNNVGMFLSANGYRSDGFNAYQQDLSGEDDGYQNRTLHTKIDLQINPSWMLRLVGRDTDARSEFDNCGYYDDEFNYQTSHDCVADYTQRAARLSAHYANEGGQHQFAASQTDIVHERYSVGQLNNDADGSTEKFEYLGNVILSQQWQMGVGAEHKTESMETTYSELSDRTQVGVYSELRYNFEDRFYASGGVRHDDHDEFGGHLSGRVSVAYIQTLESHSYLKYRAAWGTGFRAPSLYEEAYNQSSGAGLAPLTEETTQGGDIGVEYHSSGGLLLGATYFEHAITDQIEFDMINYTGYLQSSGVSHSSGVELQAQLPLASNWDLEANYTYNDTLTASDERRVRRPRRIANLGLSSRFWDERLVVFLNLRHSADAVDIGDQSLPDYTLLQANITYHVAEQGALSLRCQNLTDKDYIEATGYNTAGRGCYAGLQIEF